MPLDFNEIKDLSEKRKKEKQEQHLKVQLTEQDLKRVAGYVQQMEEYILEYADTGRQSFSYDCSRLSKHMFNAVVDKFKLDNKNFFVLVHSGTQEITVQWTGKNEV